MERSRLDSSVGVLRKLHGISVGNKKSGTGNNNGPKIVDNSKNKVGIK